MSKGADGNYHQLDDDNACEDLDDNNVNNKFAKLNRCVRRLPFENTRWKKYTLEKYTLGKHTLERSKSVGHSFWKIYHIPWSTNAL